MAVPGLRLALRPDPALAVWLLSLHLLAGVWLALMIDGSLLLLAMTGLVAHGVWSLHPYAVSVVSGAGCLLWLDGNLQWRDRDGEAWSVNPQRSALIGTTVLLGLVRGQHRTTLLLRPGVQDREQLRQLRALLLWPYAGGAGREGVSTVSAAVEAS